MKIAIVGSREFRPLKLVSDYVDSLPEGDEIVTGGARGVDSAAEFAAKHRGMKITIFPAEWEAYGLKAGYMRNKEIIDYADRVVAFWDGKSKGTKHSIDLAKEANKECEIRYK